MATSLGVGCDARTDRAEQRSNGQAGEEPREGSTRVEPLAPPRLLYLPDGGDVAYGSEFATPAPPAPVEPSVSARRCPPEMVDVAGSFCIDRFEAELVDTESGQVLSPYYPPEPGQAKKIRAYWEKDRAESSTGLGRELELPALPEFQLVERVEPMAVSKVNVVPSGYLDGLAAERACANAGKRLCKPSEWVTACRGEENRQFPYGDKYQSGTCNVFREAHPAQLLHGNASNGHLDPRLNLVSSSAGPLLRKTGATPGCRSVWGNDAVYDMVGNLDEWVEDEHGAFHGGFFARSTRLGCDARITAHPRPYEDYSLGVRCCK